MNHRDMSKERQALQKALAGLEREALRWDKAYAEGDIDLVEWRAKRHDITERKQRLLTQQEAVETTLHAAQEAQAKTRDILTYCLHVVSDCVKMLENGRFENVGCAG
jgi:hypothetical protein